MSLCLWGLWCHAVCAQVEELRSAAREHGGMEKWLDPDFEGDSVLGKRSQRVAWGHVEQIGSYCGSRQPGVWWLTHLALCCHHAVAQLTRRCFTRGAMTLLIYLRVRVQRLCVCPLR